MSQPPVGEDSSCYTKDIFLWERSLEQALWGFVEFPPQVVFTYNTSRGQVLFNLQLCSQVNVIFFLNGLNGIFLIPLNVVMPKVSTFHNHLQVLRLTGKQNILRESLLFLNEICGVYFIIQSPTHWSLYLINSSIMGTGILWIQQPFKVAMEKHFSPRHHPNSFYFLEDSFFFSFELWCLNVALV